MYRQKINALVFRVNDNIMINCQLLRIFLFVSLSLSFFLSLSIDAHVYHDDLTYDIQPTNQ